MRQQNYNSNTDTEEIAKFNKDYNLWWNKNGPFKTLHDITPIRVNWIDSLVSLADKTVLDIGTGGGILAAAMAVRGAKVVGIDLAGCAIDAANTKAKELGLDIKYHKMSIEAFAELRKKAKSEHSDTFLQDLQFESKFDVITCLEMLEHVSNPQDIISHAASLLKEDGSLFLSTINRSSKAYLQAIIVAEYLLKLLDKRTHDYDKFIKPSEIDYYLRRADMCITNITGLAYNPLFSSCKLVKSVEVNYMLNAKFL